MAHRRQFTSCDACRKSRLRCDASDNDGRCTNCARRERICSFDWLEQSTGGPQRRRRGRKAGKDSPPVADKNRSNLMRGQAEPPTEANQRVAVVDKAQLQEEHILFRKQQALTLHHVLWDIFTTLFEPQLGIWIGNECNPFKKLDTAPKALISRLMLTLDNLQSKSLDHSHWRKFGFPDLQFDVDDSGEQDVLINQALISAVHAFSARWLPLCHFRRGNEINVQESKARKEAFLESTWARALNDVTPVLTKPSYRSILALYLFGTTPTLYSNPRRPLGDHCFETSLRHYTKLRTRNLVLARSPQTSHGQLSHGLGETAATSKTQEEYEHLADTAYWFGVVIDGSRSMTRCQPSVLLPGTSGEKAVWERLRQQSENYGTMSRSIESTKAVLTDETVMTMVQYGFGCKTLVWRAVTGVQDYFFYQTIEAPFATAMENVVLEMKRFEESFGWFLDQCARDHVYLSEKSQISHLILSFHYHLGVLILVDTLEGQPEVDDLDCQFDIASCRLSSTRAIVQLINLMLQQSGPYATEGSSSIILKDPYPEHTRNGLARAAYSVMNLLHSAVLTSQVAGIMASSLLAGLEVLSQISYTAMDSLEGLRTAYSEAGLNVRRLETGPSAHLRAAASTLDSSITPQVLEEETVNQLGLAGDDPSLVDKTLERYEIIEVPLDLIWPDYIDFTFLTEDLTFERMKTTRLGWRLNVDDDRISEFPPKVKSDVLLFEAVRGLSLWRSNWLRLLRQSSIKKSPSISETTIVFGGSRDVGWCQTKGFSKKFFLG